MHFHSYSVILLLFPCGSTLLLLLQVLADYSSQTDQFCIDKHTKAILYAVYLSALSCGIVGFSLHASNNEIWCEDIGFPPCFAIYGAAKAFQIGFFLRRAKLAQGIIRNKWLHLLFNYFGPLYLVLYFIIYCALSGIVFAGAYVEEGMSRCKFGRWEFWFPILAGCVDIFNSVSTLLLFVWPLMHAMRAYDHTKLGYVSAMKWNVTLTAIATVSSFVAPFILMSVQEYVWLLCLGDPFINAVCTFLMISPNRKFIQKVCCLCRCRQHTQEKELVNIVKHDKDSTCTVSEKNTTVNTKINTELKQIHLNTAGGKAVNVLQLTPSSSNKPLKGSNDVYKISPSRSISILELTPDKSIKYQSKDLSNIPSDQSVPNITQTAQTK